MLTKLKLLLPNADENVLQLLIDMAVSYATDYTGKEFTSTMDNVIINMVLEDYNRLGAEGINSRSVSGVSESYSDNYSPKIINQLNKMRVIKLW